MKRDLEAFQRRQASDQNLRVSQEMASEILSHKICSRCQESKPIERFSKCKGHKGERRGQCNPCRARDNQARRKHKDRYKGEAGKLIRAAEYRARIARDPDFPRRMYLKFIRNRYGLTAEAYEAMLKKQGSRCAICKGDCRLYVDHCHSTGAVRGLLCQNCNSGLGTFKDNIDLLEEAISYLNQSRMQIADAEAPTLEKALTKIEAAMAIRERRAA